MHAIRKFYLHFFCFNQNIKCKFLSEAMRHKSYPSEGEFPERTVQIQTCGNLYKQWKEQNKFRKLPDEDLNFKVPYTDSRPNDLASPTVLTLHGAPGSWRDFISLSSYLHHHGCRVIAPSFPDFRTYRPGIFRHTDAEKAQYIKDFLNVVSVPKIDLLICHSSSVYPGLILSLDEKPGVKALALLNPGTLSRKDMRATQHFIFLQCFVKASENPILMKVMEVIGPSLMKNVSYVPVRCENIWDPLLSVTTMIGSNIPESKEKFLQLTSRKLPILYIFSENDPLIGSKPAYELAQVLGASASDTFIYNNEGNLIQKGTATPRLKVVAFQKGSHYSFWKYPDIVNEELVNFINVLKQH